MRQEHVQEISSAQIALLVEKSAQPAGNPLEVLLRVDEAGPQERSVCPLCPFAVENARISEPHGLVPDASTPIDGMKQMRDHIAAHLEFIALLSLPEQEELDNAASDEVQSESAKRSSRGSDRDREPLFPTSDAWYEYNTARWTEESVFENPEYTRDVLPSSEYEDWIFVTSKLRAHEPSLDPGQDPVLLPFIERARRIQMWEVLKRNGIPVIVISDPDGLEVPEPQWSSTHQQLQAAEDSITQLHNIGPNSPIEEQRKRYMGEATHSVRIDDVSRSTRDKPSQGVPAIVVEDS
ncbi:MAG: hypothetical protein Q9225_003314 [Loekoesia sp. 1 TL-2023]